jgi:hypothetical protein
MKQFNGFVILEEIDNCFWKLQGLVVRLLARNLERNQVNFNK